jgi:hypothetical protein
LSSSSSRVMPSKQTVRRISQERYIYYNSRKNLCRFPAIFFVSSRGMYIPAFGTYVPTNGIYVPAYGT